MYVRPLELRAKTRASCPAPAVSRQAVLEVSKSHFGRGDLLALLTSEMGVATLFAQMLEVERVTTSTAKRPATSVRVGIGSSTLSRKWASGEGRREQTQYATWS